MDDMRYLQPVGMDDEGNIIYAPIGRELTEEEKIEAQHEQLNDAMNVQPVSFNEKLQMLANQITEQLPEDASTNPDGTIALPYKVGYKWERTLVGTTIVYESVPDPDAIGTQDNPIIYTEKAPLIDNAFYIKDGILQVYMSGEFIEW